VTDNQVERLIAKFLKKRKESSRYTSFDYCFNYFQHFKRTGRLHEIASIENIEKSCLHLGFFLASWGMFRMSGKLGRNINAKHFQPLLKEVSRWSGQHDSARIWDIDVPDYADPEIREFLFGRYQQIKCLVHVRGQKTYRTLATKIMLGIFGCVPAFDSYFTGTFGFSKFRPNALLKIHSFFWQHEQAIDSRRVETQLCQLSNSSSQGEFRSIG
jgi:hypothetical protein